MAIFAAEITTPMALGERVSDDALTVELSDGHAISVPLTWYPRLLHASRAERSNWRLIGRGQGIHWKDLDEDISVEGLLAGRASAESQASFKRWLSTRDARSTKRVSARRRSKHRP